MQRRIDKKYNYFGHRPAPLQLKPDLKWTAQDKIDQYKSIQKIFQLNYDLERAKYESDYKEKKLQLGELEHGVKEKLLKLNELKTGDFQKIKNMLKDRGHPVDPMKPADDVLESCKCKLFDKRKALDRLRYEREQLCSLYEYKLVYLAEMQDREKYSKSHRAAEQMKVKHLEYLLGNAELQQQMYENFLNDCESIINKLTEESLHYANTLNSLEAELTEQNNILKSINKLGMPAYKSAVKTKKHLTRMERKMVREANVRQAAISSYKRTLLKNEQNIFKHLPKDDQITAVAPVRYIRETAEVAAARAHYEQLETDTKELSAAAACADINDLYTTVKDIFSKLKAGEDKIHHLEDKIVELDGQIHNAKHMKDALMYSVTDEDIQVRKQCEQTSKQIDADAQQHRLVQAKTKRITDELFKVQFAMQHLVDLLRNVDGDRPMIRKEYPNEVLTLPLFELHTTTYEDVKKPPETIEEDIDVLFETVFDRTKLLMSQYSEIKYSEAQLEDCQKLHQNLVLQELAEEDS